MHSDSGKPSGFFRKVLHLVRGTAGESSGARLDHKDLGAADGLNAPTQQQPSKEVVQSQTSQNHSLQAQSGQPSLGTVQKNESLAAPAQSQCAQGTKSLGNQDKQPLVSSSWAEPPPPELAVQHDAAVLLAGIAGDDTTALRETAVTAAAAETVSCAEPPVLRAFKLQPALEEAAILFAHGDVAAARARLLEKLEQTLGAQPLDEALAAVLWHAVLDLCRATGDEAAFEPLAIDYAKHFGRTAPLWYSMPERLGVPAWHDMAQTTPSKRQFQWPSPSVLTVGAVAALRVAHAEAPQPWSMSWLRLKEMDEEALESLAILIDAWSVQPGQFLLSDVDKLLALLALRTPVGDAAVARAWWSVRMAVLRWLHRMDDYEQVALDYCITYEVSPPSWVAPACNCVFSGESNDALLAREAADSVFSSKVAETVVKTGLQHSKLGLFGVLEGDPQACLDALAARVQPGQVVEIGCENLMRLDFVAAGCVLNWAAAMQDRGHVLRFTQLHQLVAEFFCVIGIDEHATVQATLA